MALIPMDEMNQLIAATAAKTVADSALQDLEEQSVAYVINAAANTGSHLAVWEHSLSETTISTLEGQGYTVLQDTKTVYPDIKWFIGGF